MERPEFHTTIAPLPSFFITFFSYPHHRHASPIGAMMARQCTIETASVSRDERVSGLKLFICSLTSMAPVSTSRKCVFRVGRGFEPEK
jgi:hypothetical protein